MINTFKIKDVQVIHTTHITPDGEREAGNELIIRARTQISSADVPIRYGSVSYAYAEDAAKLLHGQTAGTEDEIKVKIGIALGLAMSSGNGTEQPDRDNLSSAEAKLDKIDEPTAQVHAHLSAERSNLSGEAGYYS